MDTLTKVFEEHRQWCIQNTMKPKELDYLPLLVDSFTVLSEAFNDGLICETSAIARLNTQVKQWKLDRVQNMETLFNSLTKDGKYVADPFKRNKVKNKRGGAYHASYFPV